MKSWQSTRAEAVKARADSVVETLKACTSMRDAVQATALSAGAIRDLLRRNGYDSPNAYLGLASVANDTEIPVEWDVEDTSLETVMALGDIHSPFVDRPSWDLVKKVVTSLKPDQLVSIGDIFDHLAVSSHGPRLDERARFRAEVAQNNAFLDEIDTLNVPKKVLTLGNHDVRIDRFLERNAPELDGMVDLESMYRLKTRGWEVHPYQQHVRIGKVNFVHDIGSSGANADRELGAAFQASAVQGHTHRAGITYFGSVDGTTHVSATIGWLGSDEAASYLAKAKVHRNWQRGFATLRIERDTRNTHLQFHPIIQGRTVVDGRLYTL